MTPEKMKSRIDESEIRFYTSRSGGPGGQNVNKVNTKVELRFNVAKSRSLHENEKNRIQALLKNKINSSGEIIITSQSERSQLLNKKKSIDKFYKLLAAALTEKRKRRKTKPTKASKEERLESKKKKGEIKKFRKQSGINEDE